MKLLLDFKADPDQRGINDYTPLHRPVELNRRPSKSSCRPARTRNFDPDRRL